MATYKVLQDIEAEDKLVGPLSLRQFIYAGVAAVCLYICFLAYQKNAAFLIAVFLPIAGVCAFFGFPWKGEQPTEIWALARLRFMVKPRVRIWNQDGMKDLVTVLAPHRGPVKAPPRNLSQHEVRSRLKALADTIDSRGWATRNANYQYYVSQQRQQSDRLVNASDINPAAIPMDAFLPSNDMLDDQNPIAQNLDQLLNKSEEQKRQRVMQQIAQAQDPSAIPQQSAALPVAPATPSPSPQLPAPAMPGGQSPLSYGAIPAANPNGYWFANGPGFPAAPAQPQTAPPTANAAWGGAPANGLGPIPAAEPTEAEQAFARQLAENKQETLQINYGHMRVLKPTSEMDDINIGADGKINYGNLPGSNGVAQAQAAVEAALEGDQTPADTSGDSVTRQPDPAILELANNDDLDVATLARQANREIQKSPDEVEIQLH